MRDNNTIMMAILQIAKNDNRIRAVFQTGSRVNPQTKRDPMQDYDIIYCVRDVKDFILDGTFMDSLGPAIIVHKPDSLKTLGRNFQETFRYNVLFEDGVKIDFTFYPVEKISNLITTETLLALLMDKDNLITQLPQSSDVCYRASRPTKNEFEEAAGEFFFKVVELVPYLYRKQEVGAFYAYKDVLDLLNRMLTWYLTDEKDYKVSMGKNYRDIVKHLDMPLKGPYNDAYPVLNIDRMWKSVFAAMAIYRKVGLSLAERLGYNYPKIKDAKVGSYVREIWQKSSRPVVY